jgi:hypothetical protein
MGPWNTSASSAGMPPPPTATMSSIAEATTRRTKDRAMPEMYREIASPPKGGSQ